MRVGRVAVSVVGVPSLCLELRHFFVALDRADLTRLRSSVCVCITRVGRVAVGVVD